MNIELKGLQIYERMSEETTAFVADVYINGVKAATAKNEGHGGSTSIHAYKDKFELVAEAEAFCKSLPPSTCGFVNPEELKLFSFPMDLESFVDDLVEKEADARFAAKQKKKMQKLFVNAIVFGNDEIYFTSKMKSGISIADILKRSDADKIMKMWIDSIKPKLVKDYRILNNNIATKYLTGAL